MLSERMFAPRRIAHELSFRTSACPMIPTALQAARKSLASLCRGDHGPPVTMCARHRRNRGADFFGRVQPVMPPAAHDPVWPGLEKPQDPQP